MGRRGPAPKPTRLRIIEGNPSRRPLNHDEPKPKPIAPKCPAWLDKEAKREWKRVAPELEALGLLTVVDGATLAGYCQAYSRWLQAEQAISTHFKATGKLTYGYTNKNGSTNELAIPEIAIAQKYLALVKAFCAEFGLTPSSRSRMSVRRTEAEDDPMEALLRKPGG